MQTNRLLMEKTKVAAIFSTQLSISMASILIASLQVVNFGIESKIVFQQQWQAKSKNPDLYIKLKFVNPKPFTRRSTE